MTLLSQLRASLEAATPGPWNVGRAVGYGWQAQIWPELGAPIALMERRPGLPGSEQADARMIVAWRNAAPAILAVLEAAHRLTHSRGSGEYIKAFDDLRDALATLESGAP